MFLVNNKCGFAFSGQSTQVRNPFCDVAGFLKQAMFLQCGVPPQLYPICSFHQSRLERSISKPRLCFSQLLQAFQGPYLRGGFASESYEAWHPRIVWPSGRWGPLKLHGFIGRLRKGKWRKPGENPPKKGRRVFSPTTPSFCFNFKELNV